MAGLGEAAGVCGEGTIGLRPIPGCEDGDGDMRGLWGVECMGDEPVGPMGEAPLINCPGFPGPITPLCVFIMWACLCLFLLLYSCTIIACCLADLRHCSRWRWMVEASRCTRASSAASCSLSSCPFFFSVLWRLFRLFLCLRNFVISVS